MASLSNVESSSDLELDVGTDSSDVESSSDTESCTEPDLLDSSVNPTEIRDYAWVHCVSPERRREDNILGKWLLFRPYYQLDETWHMVRKEIENGLLTESTRAAKCSAMFYNPGCGGPGPKTHGVICVYTTKEDVDKAGLILINMVKHDIKYKTDEATLDGKYAWKGEGKSVCLKTLYWNGGKPSFQLEGELCYGPNCRGIKDEWHINCVTAPESVMSQYTLYGRWVIKMDPDWGLTEYWQGFRKLIEKGKWGPVEMVCPAKVRHRDPNEATVFLLYTACENKEFVGLTLALFVEKDIVYELSPEVYKRSLFYKPVYNHRITWIDDEPVYVMTLNRPNCNRKLI